MAQADNLIVVRDIDHAMDNAEQIQDELGAIGFHMESCMDDDGNTIWSLVFDHADGTQTRFVRWWQDCPDDDIPF